MEEFFNKLKNMHGVTRLDLRGSDIEPAKHLYVIVSKMYCTSNEVAVCYCDEEYICGICYKSKGYDIIDGQLKQTVL